MAGMARGGLNPQPYSSLKYATPPLGHLSNTSGLGLEGGSTVSYSEVTAFIGHCALGRGSF